jgi:UDP-glucose 4-epimerase
MRVLVTGGAGFIGSHLCDALVERGDEVFCVDDLSLGREENIAHLRHGPGFQFVKLDVLDPSGMDALLAGAGCEAVFHLAANSDIRRGSEDRQVDLQATFHSTLAVLEAMLRHGVRRIFFASTSAIFGDTREVLDEDFGPLRPVSFYGASKLAAEAYLSAFVHHFALRASVLRFPNVVGPRSTHGAVHDFIGRLREDPSRLVVLGDGSQTKPYLYVGDLVRAMLLVFDRAGSPLDVYHVAGEGQTSVGQIARIVVEEMGLDGIPIEYTGGSVGWVGDVPFFQYDTARIRRLGFAHRYDSTAAVRLAVRKILGKE